MLDEILDRVDRRLDAVGMTAAEACLKAGLSRTFLSLTRRAVSKGKAHGGSVTLFHRLASVLDTSVGWLIDGSGAEQITDRAPKIGEHCRSGTLKSASWDDVFGTRGTPLLGYIHGLPLGTQISLRLESSQLLDLGGEGDILLCVVWRPGDPIRDQELFLVEKSTVWGKWRRQSVCRAVKTEKGFDAYSLGKRSVNRGSLHLSQQKLRDCIFPLARISHTIRIL
ncbi:hypothetical protein [Metarhizobium album]|uniref:hypothetical protein n=1 Tax=Metarhizobium album TaxID=2182425 RepID=UPI000FFF0ED8|nr:hypothetical protein [Rhizobium album]